MQPHDRMIHNDIFNYFNNYCGTGSSVGIATDLPGWTVRDRIPVGMRFSAHPD